MIRFYDSRRGRLAGVVVCSLILSLVPTDPAAMAKEVAPEPVFARTVEITPTGDASLSLLGHRYRGRLMIAGFDEGLAVNERTSIDRYLEGIAEVPFGWHEEALAAQAIAARTYLAWTLDRGRTRAGRIYGYDICATPACQVYSGVDLVEGPQGERWKRAVETTSDQILLYEGRPAQALYSSTFGPRSRNVEDVFVGSAPAPYLSAVDVPAENSPYVEWSFTLSGTQADLLFGAAGLADGHITSITTQKRADGDGPWTIRVVSDGDDTSTGSWDLRTVLNRVAPEIMPDVLPARRPGGGRYPQTILSPSFEISELPGWILTHTGPAIYDPSFRFEGNGWGHNVGMSQYGAQAMADAGRSRVEILSHFYTGLVPEVSDSVLPADVTVGLQTDLAELVVAPDGPVRVEVDGSSIGDEVLGDWRLEAFEGGVLVHPPAGLGLAPVISGVRFDGRVVWFDLNTTARLQVDGIDGGIRAPGVVVHGLRQGVSVITIEVENPQGRQRITLRVPRRTDSPSP